ncbi:MAG: LysR family transcriptional regulator [Chloroflexota bacterium]
MNFSQFQAFVALAEMGSFTEVANAINLTQSAVSHALTALESELGVTLLERNRKGVVALTNVGQVIIPHVRALLAQVEAIEQEAKAAQGRTMGKLRLGNTFCLSPGLLASVMTCFQQQYPDVELVLFEGTMNEVEEWIASSIIDVGFVPLPATGIDSTLITTDELQVVLAAGHHLHAQRAITLDDLNQENFIMPKNECSFRLMGMTGMEPSRIKASMRYQASDSATILAMVREGLGITLLPRMMLPAKLDGIVALPLDPPQHIEIGLGIKARAMASPVAKLFVQTTLAWAHRQAGLLVPVA